MDALPRHSASFTRHRRLNSFNREAVPAQARSLTDGREFQGPTASSSASPSVTTVAAFAMSLLIGSIYCITDVYFGLRTGRITGSPMATAFLAKWFLPSMTEWDNMMVVCISTAVAVMSVAGGFLGPISALEFLVGPEDNKGGPLVLTRNQLLIWAVGVSIMGPLFAMALRAHFLETSEGQREALPFPSATAAAKVIHGYSDTPASDADLVARSPVQEPNEDSADVHSKLLAPQPRSLESEVGSKKWAFAVSGAVSGLWTGVTFFYPILHHLPRSGSWIARRLGYVDLSLGFIGQGIIVGPSVVYGMYLGALCGCVLLSALLQVTKWAPGDVDDWENGVRGWVVWPGLAALLADCSFGVIVALWRVIYFLWQAMRSGSPGQHNNRAPKNNDNRPISTPSVNDSARAIAHNTNNRVKSKVESEMHNWTTLGLGLLIFIFFGLLCILFVKIAVGKSISSRAIILAIGLALPASYMSILATGKTDITPASAFGMVSQFVLAISTSRSCPGAVISNLIGGAIVESASCHAATLMFDLKAGAILGILPSALLWGQVFGSLIGIIVASSSFKYFTSPSVMNAEQNIVFEIPTAHMWIKASRLAENRGLPKYALECSILMFAIFVCFNITKTVWKEKRFVDLLPDGTSFAMGMYNPPAVTIGWAAGGLVRYLWDRKHRDDQITITLVAGGLMLAEGATQLALTLVKKSFYN